MSVAAQMAALPFTEIRAAFHAWMADGGRMALDRDKYMIDGEFCVDHVLRYEALADGIKAACDKISAPFEPERLQRWGAHKRGPIPNLYTEYYNDALAGVVAQAYAPEIERFGYRFGEDV
jgi:hypothetical protein